MYTSRSMASYGDHAGSEHISNIKSLLNDYYQALTHMCSTGLQLAGRLEKELQAPKHICLTGKSTTGKENGFHELIHKMSQIKSHYSEIISKLGPLWEQIQRESPNVGEAMEEQKSRHQSGNQQLIRVEGICRCLIEFHRSTIESGLSLLDQKLLPTSKNTSKLPLTRKTSPFIVITDTDSERPSASSKVRRPRCSTPKHFTRTQPPSDDDMNNIINFLSSTRGASVKRETSPVTPRRLALSNQRSSPLPGSSEGTLQMHSAMSNDLRFGFARHNSDWQLFSRATPQNDTGVSTWSMGNYGVGQIAYSSYNTNRAPAFNPNTSSMKPLPFSNWSTSVNKDNIWSNEYPVSGGDGSKQDPTAAAVVRGDSPASCRMYRRPSDSSDGSQTFDPTIAFINSQQHQQSSVNPALSSTPPPTTSLLNNEVWSKHAAVAQCWPNSAAEDTTSVATSAISKSLSSTGLCDQNTIWRPIDLSSPGLESPLCPIMTGGAHLIPQSMASPYNHSKIKPSHSSLL